MLFECNSDSKIFCYHTMQTADSVEQYLSPQFQIAEWMVYSSPFLLVYFTIRRFFFQKFWVLLSVFDYYTFSSYCFKREIWKAFYLREHIMSYIPSLLFPI